jgi:hypothetical protein
VITYLVLSCNGKKNWNRLSISCIQRWWASRNGTTFTSTSPVSFMGHWARAIVGPCLGALTKAWGTCSLQSSIQASSLAPFRVP